MSSKENRMPDTRPSFPLTVSCAPPARPGRPAGVARLLLGALAVVGVLLALPEAAQAKASPSPAPATGHPAQPSLSITVTDNVTKAAPGETLAYTVTVSNDGDAASGQVPVKLTLPGGVEFASADNGGTSEQGAVVWKVTVPAAGHLTLTARGTVGTPAAGLNGLAGVACLEAGPANMLCSSDIDQIPGRRDVHAVTRAGGHTITPIWRRWWVLGTPVALAVIVGLALVFLLRRRQRTRTAGGGPAL